MRVRWSEARLPASTVLTSQGDIANQLFDISPGSTSVAHDGVDVADLGTTDFQGDIAPLNQGVRTVAVTCTSRTRLVDSQLLLGARRMVRSCGSSILRYRTLTVVVFAMVVIPACASRQTTLPSSSSPSGTGSGRLIDASKGCVGSDPLSLPRWAAGVDGLVGKKVLSARGSVVGIVFANTLRSGTATLTGPSNKILWVVQQPRSGKAMHISGTLAGTGEVLETVEPASAGPGEIYPMIVDAPAAGCWKLDLEWNGNHDQVFLPYE